MWRDPKYDRHPLVIRRETFGTLLYSASHAAYFLATEAPLVDDLENLLDSPPHVSTRLSALEAVLVSMGLLNGVEEYRSHQHSGPLGPLDVYFDFTNRCNLRCPGCYNLPHLGKTTMSRSDVLRVLSDTHALGCRRLHLAGGEPTVDPDGLIHYLSTAWSLNLVTSVTTNGTLISRELAAEVLPLVRSLTVSIDRADEESNALIRAPGALDKSLAAVSMMMDLRDTLRLETRICIKATCDVHMPLDKMHELAAFAAHLGIDELKFSCPERSEHHEKGHYGRIASRYYKMAQHMKEVAAQWAPQVRISPVNNPAVSSCAVGLPGMKGCIGGNELIAIHADGDITPCLMYRHVLGNVHKTRLSDYWKSSSIEAYRASMSSPKCTDCSVYEQCRGGCQVRKAVEGRQLSERDPLCPIDNGQQLLAHDLTVCGGTPGFGGLRRISVLHSL